MGKCTCIRGGDIRLTPLAPFGEGSSASGLWTAVIVEWRSVAAIHKERDFLRARQARPPRSRGRLYELHLDA
jgi:hypothetical protein